MKSEAIKARMRQLEWFHSLRALPGAWIILRVDGRSFSRLTEARFEKPFDVKFHELMLDVGRALLTELHGLLVYTESDEASLLLSCRSEIFDREVEKLVSLSASVAAAAFSHALGAPAHFDSRLWLGVRTEDVVDYFRWRQADAARCCLNGWCYWTLRKEGMSVDAATRALHGKQFSYKNELLFQRGINFSKVPAWQRRGTAVYWRNVQEQGRNPITGETTTAKRRRIHVDDDLPRGAAFESFILQILGGDTSS
jgi:tRNA(His) 5'-end guanylyltransferase